MLDLILRNCNVIDGVSEVSYHADIGILDEVIVKVGDLKEFKATCEIDCAGKIAAPGFIDVHSHSDLNPFIEGGFESKIRQGVTTEVIGNCGYSVYPLAGEFGEKVKKEGESLGVEVSWRSFEGYVDEAAKKGMLTVNVVPLVGLSALRSYHTGYSARPLSNLEIENMKNHLAAMIKEGAAGASTGMIYPPCCYFEPEELTSLIRVVADLGGVYSTHMRSEGDYLLEAVSETLQIMKKTNVNLQISHLKTAERHNWHKIESVFELLDAAVDEGYRVGADRYPYLASQTTLDMILPKWVFDGGDESALRRISDPLVSGKVKSEISKNHAADSDYWESVVVSNTHCNEFIRFEGLNFKQIFNMLKSSRADCQKFDIIDCLFYFLKKEKMKTSAIFFNMCEKNLESIVKKPYVTIGSDATARMVTGPLATGKPHPRAFSTFVKYLTDFVFKKQIFSLARAISKITSWPAQKFGLVGRGRIAPTFYADVTVIDPDCFSDKSTYVQPFSYPDGINYVIVNGKMVFSKFEQCAKCYPGRILLHN